MLRLLILIPVAAVLFACGLIARNDAPATQVVETPVAPTEEPAVQLDVLLPPPTGQKPPPVASALVLPPYAGDSLIEEKIIEYPVIVKATMTSFSSDTFLYPDDTFRPVLQFNLNVR